MITQAIFEIADRKGASRDALWKFVQMKFPEDVRDKKIFLVRLNKIAKEDNQVHRVPGNAMRYRLETNYRGRMVRALAKGEKLKPTRSKAMTKKTKDSKMKQSKLKKNKMSKTVKGKQTLKKDKKTKAKQTKKDGKKAKDDKKVKDKKT